MSKEGWYLYKPEDIEKLNVELESAKAAHKTAFDGWHRCMDEITCLKSLLRRGVEMAQEPEFDRDGDCFHCHGRYCHETQCDKMNWLKEAREALGDDS